MTSAFAGPAEIALVVDTHKLGWVSVTATPLVITCVVEGEDVACGDWDPGSLSVSWTAVADPQRGSRNDQVTTRCFVEVYHSRGTTRVATATGSLDGATFGMAVFGQVFDGTYAAQSIRHTCPFPPEEY